MLEVSDIEFAYDPSRPVLRGVSHLFAPGKLTALVGPNGAGKSTLIKIMLGVLEPPRGTVQIAGKNIKGYTKSELANLIGYIPQRGEVAFAYTVREVLHLGLYGKVQDRSSSEALVDQYLEESGLKNRENDSFSALSAGQQQRVTLARVFVQLHATSGSKRVILADEPVSAMDPRFALQSLKKLREQAKQGATVVVILHDLHLACGCCDQAVVLDATGSIKHRGPVASTLLPANLAEIFETPFAMYESSGVQPSTLAKIGL